MGNDKNRKIFFKKHLTNENNGCIIRHIKGNGVFGIRSEGVVISF